MMAKHVEVTVPGEVNTVELHKKNFTKIVYCFLENLCSELNRIDPTLSPDTREKIYAYAAEVLLTHFKNDFLSEVFLKSKIAFYKYNFYVYTRPKVKEHLKKFRSLFKVEKFPLARLYRFFARVDSKLMSNAEISKYVYSWALNVRSQELETVATKIVEKNYQKLFEIFTKANLISKSQKKECILITRFFRTTWLPTFQELYKKNWNTHLFVHHAVKWSPTYGICDDSELPPHQDLTVSGLLEDLILMVHLKNHPILLDNETYFEVQWDSFKAITLYLMSGVIAKTVRECRGDSSGNLVYLMYDSLKPVKNNTREVNKELSKFYQFYLSMADKIIFNSNDKSFGDFVENSYNITCPKLHFPRYSAQLTNPKKRLGFGPNNDELHVACITVCLDTVSDAARDSAPDFIRSLLEQRIHFHYYASDPKFITDAFVASLSKSARKYFHTYPFNRNQGELIEELHQYHIGFNPADYRVFSAAQSSLQDLTYADALHRYFHSTYPSSVLVYAAAGLPVMISSAMCDIGTFLKDICIPILPSESANMARFLKKIDVKELCARADEQKHRAWASSHIELLDNFLSEKGDFPHLKVC